MAVYYFLGVLAVWILFLLILFGAWMWRKYPTSSTLSTHLFTSPCRGNVSFIEAITIEGKDFWKIILHNPFWNEKGLYLPIASEINQINWSGNKCKIFLTTLSDSKFDYSLDIESNMLKPHLWILEGDCGRNNANIGFLPFGGKITIYLPKDNDYHISVELKDNVHPEKDILNDH